MTTSKLKNNGLSGLVVAHNEEEVIEDALKSLHFCDEIIVCLDRCTDGTKTICSKYATKIIEGKECDGWEIEGKRRGIGIDACSNKWILELDADERITPELAKEIPETIANSEDGYYIIPIDNYVGNRLVKYGWAGSFGTNRAKKLFAKGCKVWGMQRAHPSLQLKGKEMELKNSIIHLVDKDINDMIDRLKRYTDWVGADMADKGHLPPFKNSVRRGLTRFYKSYFARKGYKEGRMGVLLALMAMMFIIISHIKAECELGAKYKNEQ